jgi:hypothetical protein
MTMAMELLTVGEIAGKNILVAQGPVDFLASDLPSLPTCFSAWLLLSNDWSTYAEEDLRVLFTRLIASGAVFLGMWGRGSAKAHDIADELLMLDNPRASLLPIPISWEDEDDVTEEMWHFVFSYSVDDQFAAECTWVAASMDGQHCGQDLIKLIRAAAEQENDPPQSDLPSLDSK